MIVKPKNSKTRSFVIGFGLKGFRFSAQGFSLMLRSKLLLFCIILLHTVLFRIILFRLALLCLALLNAALFYFVSLCSALPSFTRMALLLIALLRTVLLRISIQFLLFQNVSSIAFFQERHRKDQKGRCRHKQ